MDLLRAELVPATDWIALLDAALDHGVLPLVHRHLSAIARRHENVIPKWVIERLRIAHQGMAARSLLLTAELRRVVTALAGASIPALPYKGATLAALVYGDVALRQFVDLDILVSLREFDTARDTMALLGYAPEHAKSATRARRFSSSGHEESFVSQTAKVELQWRLADAYYGANVSVDDMWPGRWSMTIAGAEVMTLGAEDLLLALCVHGNTHMWNRLIWISDVAELLRRSSESSTMILDWDRVRDVAHRAHSSRRVRLGVALARDILDAPLPPAAHRWINSDATITRLVAIVENELTGRSSSTFTFAFHVRSSDTVSDGIRVAVHALFTPMQEDATYFPLPDRLRGFYRLVRPIRLLFKAVSAVRRRR